MNIRKELSKGSSSLLVLSVLGTGDMYGYQMIETLRSRSEHAFDLKAGTLYPLLHALEQKGYITAWDEPSAAGRPRRYYHLTGRKRLQEKETEWNAYTRAVGKVLKGGAYGG